MKVVIPYIVKHFVDMTELGGSKVVLSPYDLETLVVEGSVVQPKITITSQTSFSDFARVANTCENPVYVSKNLIECSAVTGFSHLEHGVAIVRDAKNYKVVTKDEVFLGGILASEVKPGAFIVAIHDGRNTHVILASHDDYVVYRNAYKKKPVRCSLGFKLATCVFSDERSLVIHRGRAYEVGFPAEALASTSGGPLLRSGEWLLYSDEENLKPILKSKASFAGFIYELPVFREGSKLKILDSGALVDYVDVAGNATAWDLVVDDLGEFLRVVDLKCKEVLRLPKDLGVACWATKDGVVCCRGLWCGLIDVGETVVDVEPSFKGFHTLRIYANTLLHARYGEESVKCYSGCEISDERASVLREHAFGVVLEHLLSTTEVKVVSKPAQARVLFESAKLYVSDGIHACGGKTYFEGRIREIVKPERTRVYLGSAELESGINLSMCLSSYNPELYLRVLDPITGDEILLNLLNYEVVRVSRPEVGVRIENSGSLTKISISVEPGTEVIEKKICCSLKCQELSDVVRDCRLPAWIEVRTRKNNFMFNHFFDVKPTPKILECLQKSFVRREELITCREGGFLTSYVSPDFPEIPPIYDLRIEILPRNAVILFKSRVLGRVLIVGGSEVKVLQLKPGEMCLSTPFSENYLILVDAGKYWRYEIKLSTEEILKTAFRHANLINQLLRTDSQGLYI